MSGVVFLSLYLRVTHACVADEVERVAAVIWPVAGAAAVHLAEDTP